MWFSPPAQSQSTLRTHQRPASNQSWMLLIPLAKGSPSLVRALA